MVSARGASERREQRVLVEAGGSCDAAAMLSLRLPGGDRVPFVLGHLSRLPPRLAPEGAVLKGGVQEAAVPQG